MPLVPCRRLEFPVSLERGAHHFLFAQGLADAAPGPGGAPVSRPDHSLPVGILPERCLCCPLGKRGPLCGQPALLSPIPIAFLESTCKMNYYHTGGTRKFFISTWANPLGLAAPLKPLGGGDVRLSPVICGVAT